jgi:hypothetical protein
MPERLDHGDVLIYICGCVWFWLAGVRPGVPIMADANASMVMRSVYLPPDMDEALRNLAFQLRLSKADLIRAFVAGGLNDVVRRLGPKPDEARIAKVAAALGAGRLPEAERRRSQVAMERFRAAAAESARSVAKS